MWWLIFCVNHGVPRSNIISGHVWRCFQMRLAFEFMYLVKQTAFPNVVATIQSLEGLNRTREEQGGIHLLLLPHTARAGTFYLTFSCLQTSNWNLHHQLPWFSGLQTWSQDWINSTSFPGSPGHRQQILGLNLHICLIVNLHYAHPCAQTHTHTHTHTHKHTHLIGSLSLEKPD